MLSKPSTSRVSLDQPLWLQPPFLPSFRCHLPSGMTPWHPGNPHRAFTPLADTLAPFPPLTGPGTVDEILYIEAAAGTPANSVLSQSASPYFMVINAAPTASDPISFTDSLSSLPFTTTDAAVVHLWVAYNGYLLPVTDGGSLLQAPGGGGAYLVPVDGADGTYSLRWIMDADLAGALGGSKVLLSSLPVLAVASS